MDQSSDATDLRFYYVFKLTLMLMVSVDSMFISVAIPRHVCRTRQVDCFLGFMIAFKMQVSVEFAQQKACRLKTAYGVSPRDTKLLRLSLQVFVCVCESRKHWQALGSLLECCSAPFTS